MNHGTNNVSVVVNTLVKTASNVGQHLLAPKALLLPLSCLLLEEYGVADGDVSCVQLVGY